METLFYFIILNLSEIPKRTPLSGNIDNNKLIYCLKDVQLSVLEPALGTKLYDKMKTDFAIPQTYIGDYETLYNDYIIPILAHSTASEYMISHFMTFDDSGAHRKTSENTQLVDVEDINNAGSKQRAKADIYIDRMIRFLKDKDITEYEEDQDNDYDIDADDEIKTFGGWYLQD